MSRIVEWWYGHPYPVDPEFARPYIEDQRRYPRLRFSHFRAGRPGGFWGVHRGHHKVGHRAWGYRFYGAFGRLGFSIGIWPVWAIRFEGYLFPPRA